MFIKQNNRIVIIKAVDSCRPEIRITDICCTILEYYIEKYYENIGGY
jgi:hypothetical protein